MHTGIGILTSENENTYIYTLETLFEVQNM